MRRVENHWNHSTSLDTKTQTLCMTCGLNLRQPVMPKLCRDVPSCKSFHVPFVNSTKTMLAIHFEIEWFLLFSRQAEKQQKTTPVRVLGMVCCYFVVYGAHDFSCLWQFLVSKGIILNGVPKVHIVPLLLVRACLSCPSIMFIAFPRFEFWMRS